MAMVVMTMVSDGMMIMAYGKMANGKMAMDMVNNNGYGRMAMNLGRWVLTGSFS
jgi:hypothetical protein